MNNISAWALELIISHKIKAWSYQPAHADTFLQVSQVYKNIYSHLGQQFQLILSFPWLSKHVHIFLFLDFKTISEAPEHQTLLDNKDI